MLNPHYIETRYPVEVDYTETIVKTSLKNAKKVVAWAKKNLEESKKV
jgi:HEPN domain-containing protein